MGETQNEELAVTKKQQAETPQSFQNTFDIASMLSTAGTIELTDDQKQILEKPINQNDIEIRPDGLIYAPWMEYATRLREMFGMKWALIPQGLPETMGNFIYWGHWLVIDGKIASYAIGEQAYHPSNRTMSYSDACEGAVSNALMRCCKRIGITLELWKPSFIREWKEKYADTYVDHNGKTKWKLKTQPVPKSAKQNGYEQLGKQQQSFTEDEFEWTSHKVPLEYWKAEKRSQERYDIIKNICGAGTFWPKKDPNDDEWYFVKKVENTE